MVTATRRLITGAGASGIFAPPASEVLQAFTLASPPNGGWCWFADPRAYYHGGKTFVGWMDGQAGLPMAAEYDHGTGLLSTPDSLYTLATFETDDHDNPALLRRDSDGRILAA